MCYRVTNLPPAVVLGVIFIAFVFSKQVSFLNLSQNLISQHASLDYNDVPATSIEEGKEGLDQERKLKSNGTIDAIKMDSELMFQETPSISHEDNSIDSSTKQAKLAEGTPLETSVPTRVQPNAPTGIEITQVVSEEPEDGPLILQGNPDDDHVEISLDDAGDESEKPYGALKMIEEAVANAAKLAKEKSYQKYGVDPDEPLLDESVPLSHFSHIHYVGIAGLGHRLVRHAAAVYVGRRLGFAVRGYWSNHNDFSNGTKDLFLELFEPFTREEFAFVNSTNRTIRFANGVSGMKGPAIHCSTRQNGICRQRNSRGIECETCGCTNDEIQVHYDFYRSLRNKYTRRHVVSAFMEKHKFASHTVIGIHIRAGNGEKRDFTFKNRGIHHDPKECVAAVIEAIRKGIPSLDSLQKPPLIFLATDQSNYRDLVVDQIQNHQNLSWPVVFLEQDFSKSGVVLYGHGKYKEKWHSMCQDMVLLSHADVLVATKYSSFTQALPMSLVLGRPESERTVQDNYCEVIDENDDGSNKQIIGPKLHLYCYNSYMQNCCGTSNKVHRKVTKFLHPRLRTMPINVTIEEFYPGQYFSFDDSLGRFVWNVSRNEEAQ